MISENYEDEGGYYTQKNIKTGKIIGRSRWYTMVLKIILIKTKSVYDPVDLESDGFRILIMRKWPRGIGYKKHSIHKWSKELGPSRQLLTNGIGTKLPGGIM